MATLPKELEAVQCVQCLQWLAQSHASCRERGAPEFGQVLRAPCRSQELCSPRQQAEVTAGKGGSLKGGRRLRQMSQARARDRLAGWGCNGTGRRL